MKELIESFFTVYTYMILLRILLSWVPEWGETRPALFLKFCTDPYLNIFRSIIPPFGMMDFSPIVALIALSFLQSLTVYVVSYFLV